MIDLLGSRWFILCLLLFLAALPRIISWLVFDFIDSGGGSDTVGYLSLARNLFTGRGFSSFGEVHTIHHPFYPVMIGVVWRLIGDLLLAGHMVSLSAGIALVIPVYYLARHLFGPRAAWYSGLCTALFPVLVYGSSEPFSESLYTFLLVAGGAVFAAGWRGRRVWDLAATGGLYGLAFLTHPAGITFLPVLALFLLATQFTAARTAWKIFLARLILLAAAFSLVASPWWFYLRRATGHWQLSGSSHYQNINLTVDAIKGKEEAAVIFEHMESIYHPAAVAEEREAVGLLEIYLRHPRKALQVVSFNLAAAVRNLRKSARFLGLNPCLLAGILGAAALVLIGASIPLAIKKRLGLEVLLVMLMFLPALTFILVLMQHRYFYPFFPFALVLLGAILAAGEESGAYRVRIFSRLFLWATLILFLAGSAGVIWRKWDKAAIPYEYKLLGEWMRDNIKGIKEEKVMSFRLGVPFYAESSWNVFFWGDYPGLLNYLRLRGVRYLVIDDYKLDMIHPELRFLIVAPPPAEFEEIKTVEFKGRRARLLRLLPGFSAPE